MKNRIWFPIFLLLGSLFLIVHGLNSLSLRAMRFPLIVGGVASILLLVEIFGEIFSRRQKDTLKETKEGGLKELRSHLPAIAMLLAILPLIWILGFLIAIPLHLFLFLKFNGEKWLQSFITGFVTWIILYFGLSLGMRIPFDEGLLFAYIFG